MGHRALPGHAWGRFDSLHKLAASIGTKIILPYLLLTLLVAAIGAYVVTNLVTGSLQERFDNQLLDAGRVASERMVGYEQERLAVLRGVAATQGVAQALAGGDVDALAGLVPQIVANSGADAVELLDARGQEVFGWQRPPGQSGPEGEVRSGADFSRLDDVQRVLSGPVDEFGEKRALLAETPYGPMVFAVGPVRQGEELVGAVMVGTYLAEMVDGLSQSAVARVTLYDRNGTVLDTSLGGGQEGIRQELSESPERYQQVTRLLQEAPDRYQGVVAEAEDQVRLKQITIMGQPYALAYGDWRLRGQSFGFFSVALPTNFLITAAAASRNVLSLIFSAATVAVIAIGYFIAQRIIHPLGRLVETSEAVAAGDLDRRTGIQRSDEIGSLASSFDVMTERLVERNRELVEQASELTAILNSIADGVIVLDRAGAMVTSNPAAQAILAEMSPATDAPALSEAWLAARRTPPIATLDQLLAPGALDQPQRFQAGDRVLSALAAPVVAPDGEELGAVVVLRDITREVESERLKDEFITNVSHELRTPLTAIKGYSDLLMMTADGELGERHLSFVHTIGDNADQLLAHINHLIDISQIQANNLGLERDRLSFSDLVRQVVESWRERMEAKGLSLRTRLPGASLWVNGDRDRLAWAIDNILSNACNYTLPGGRVAVRAFREEGEARIDVADTGVGVAAADQPYLFTRFFRAHNELTFSVRGVGLGLFITRSIVELHGGRVWAESELGVGSTFSVALPLEVDG